eukprot:gene6701-biopygen8507
MRRQVFDDCSCNAAAARVYPEFLNTLLNGAGGVQGRGQGWGGGHAACHCNWLLHSPPHLQELAHCCSDEFAIWAEGGGCYRPFEAEVVQQYSPLSGHEQRSASVIHRQQQLSVRAEAEGADLRRSKRRQQHGEQHSGLCGDNEATTYVKSSLPAAGCFRQKQQGQGSRQPQRGARQAGGQAGRQAGRHGFQLLGCCEAAAAAAAGGGGGGGGGGTVAWQQCCCCCWVCQLLLLLLGVSAAAAAAGGWQGAAHSKWGRRALGEQQSRLFVKRRPPLAGPCDAQWQLFLPKCGVQLQMLSTELLKGGPKPQGCSTGSCNKKL